MKKMIAFLLLFIFVSFAASAYEEPVKTLKEKKEKETLRDKSIRAKIKTMSANKFEIVDGKENESPAGSIFRVFDPDGNLVLLQTFKGDQMEKKSKFYYDDADNMTKQEAYSEDPKPVETTTFAYDAEGRIMSGETIDNNGVVTESFVYSFSKDKKIITLRKYKGKTVLANTVDYLYADDYDKSPCYELDAYDDCNNLISKTDFHYNAKSLLEEKVIYGRDNKEKSKFQYKYDENGNETQITLMKADKTIAGYEERTYDPNNVLTRIKVFSAEGKMTSIVKVEISYYFDERMPRNVKGETIETRFPPPDNFTRVNSEPGSFGDYLRKCRLKEDGAPVKLFDGSTKSKKVWAAVLDMPILNRDLVQSAGAIIKLRAEYLYQVKEFDKIVFSLTSGVKVPFSRFSEGWRMEAKGDKTEWVQKGKRGTGREVFDEYLEFIYNHCGTASLSADMIKADIKDIQIGDVFLQSGTPGHGVIVADLAENPHGIKAVLLAQGSMPSQEVHVLESYYMITPWFRVEDAELKTPEWNFPQGSLMRFDKNGDDSSSKP
jgi:hypothetical protein